MLPFPGALIGVNGVEQMPRNGTLPPIPCGLTYRDRYRASCCWWLGSGRAPEMEGPDGVGQPRASTLQCDGPRAAGRFWNVLRRAAHRRLASAWREHQRRPAAALFVWSCLSRCTDTLTVSLPFCMCKLMIFQGQAHLFWEAPAMVSSSPLRVAQSLGCTDTLTVRAFACVVLQIGVFLGASSRNPSSPTQHTSIRKPPMLRNAHRTL